MTQCIDQYTQAENDAAIANDVLIERDEVGNILKVSERKSMRPLATFGDYDAAGRPGWYSDGMATVSVSWAAGNSCLFTALTSLDWTTRFSWGDLDHLAGVDVPVSSNTVASYLFSYLDGELSGVVSKTPVSPWATSTVTQVWAQGALVSSNKVTTAVPALVPSPTTSALSAHTAAASVAADPFFQPKVKVLPAAVPGGPAQIEVLGPLSLLYPVFDYLGRQIARFAVNMNAASVDSQTNQKCLDNLNQDYATCEQAVDDKYRPTFGSGPWPPEAAAERRECDKSARERYAACIAGQALPALRLPLPAGTTTARKQCEDAAWKQYQSDFLVCEQTFNSGYEFEQCVKRAMTKYNAAVLACKGK
jgi:hypothetical protein